MTKVLLITISLFSLTFLVTKPALAAGIFKDPRRSPAGLEVRDKPLEIEIKLDA